MDLGGLLVKISEARYRANKKYDQKTYTRVTIMVRKDDAEMLAWLDGQESKNGYILNLIRADMKKKGETK